MWRASMPYGRKGLAVHALSAVDLALWDLLAKLRGEPVYGESATAFRHNVVMTCAQTTLLGGRSLHTDGCVSALLGGKTKDKVPVYCTTARPDLAQGLGFVGAKYPLAHGPADGNVGLKKNVEIHKKWRAAGAHPPAAPLNRLDR